MASTLAVIAYPEQGTAEEAAKALARMQKGLLIELEDVAWVTKAQQGVVRVSEVLRAVPSWVWPRCL